MRGGTGAAAAPALARSSRPLQRSRAQEDPELFATYMELVAVRGTSCPPTWMRSSPSSRIVAEGVSAASSTSQSRRRRPGRSSTRRRAPQPGTRSRVDGSEHRRRLRRPPGPRAARTRGERRLEPPSQRSSARPRRGRGAAACGGQLVTALQPGPGGSADGHERDDRGDVVRIPNDARSSSATSSGTPETPAGRPSSSEARGGYRRAPRPHPRTSTGWATWISCRRPACPASGSGRGTAMRRRGRARARTAARGSRSSCVRPFARRRPRHLRYRSASSVTTRRRCPWKVPGACVLDERFHDPLDSFGDRRRRVVAHHPPAGKQLAELHQRNSFARPARSSVIRQTFAPRQAPRQPTKRAPLVGSARA